MNGQQEAWREYNRDTRDLNVALDEFVYCHNCKKVVGWKLHEMGPGPNDSYAQDLQCRECDWIIATFHEKQPVTMAVEGELMKQTAEPATP